MTIQDIFINSNLTLKQVIDQIKDNQWDIELPKGMTSKPANLKQSVQYHTYDDAWVPDVLDAKTKEEVGTKFEFLLTNDDVIANYDKYNDIANEAVRNFSDLDKKVHLSYGDFSARDYLQHITSFRAFRAYDIAKLIGVDLTYDPDLIDALMNEFKPVIEDYRKMGIFSEEIKVDVGSSPQIKLLAMFGRR